MGEHASGPRRAGAEALIRASLLLVLLLVHPAGPSAAASQPGLGLAVEEVLRQAARITWSDETGGDSTRHRVQRRTRLADGGWSEWSDVATGSDAHPPGYVVDAGPDAKGLPPADYEYRVQSLLPGDAAQPARSEWSEWSTPTGFTMPPQCAGGDDPPGNEAPGSLPTVEIRDLDGDGRHTGTDVWIAIQRCSKLGGCVLQALPVTYDDVAISLYGQNDLRPCKYWNALVCEPMPPLANGLVLQGHGSATVFRSPVWRTPYQPSAIFQFWHAPGVQLRFRNFVLDGRKPEQPDPTPGTNQGFMGRHWGIDVTHYFGPDHRLGYPNGCVHNVTVRDFLLGGIEVDHVRNWRIEYNRVQDVGCWKGLTECPRLTMPDADSRCVGYKASGYGIQVGNYSDDTQVSHNEIARVAKYGLGFKGGNEGNDPITRISVRDNRIVNVGSVGIFLAGLIDSVVERNLVDGTHEYGCRGTGAWSTWGIQTHGTMRNTRVRENTLRNLAGVGIGSNAVADGLVFSDNRIDNVCVERNASVGDAKSAIHFSDGSAGSFTLSGNTVTGNHCSMALAVCWGSQAQVVVDGGYYSTAENSDANYGALYVESANSPRSPRVVLKGGVVFDYLGRQRRPGIVASGNGHVVVQDDSVRVNNYRDPFVPMKSCMDGCATQRTGSIVRCAASPSHPECL